MLFSPTLGEMSDDVYKCLFSGHLIIDHPCTRFNRSSLLVQLFFPGCCCTDFCPGCCTDAPFGLATWPVYKSERNRWQEKSTDTNMEADMAGLNHRIESSNSLLSAPTVSEVPNPGTAWCAGMMKGKLMKSLFRGKGGVPRTPGGPVVNEGDEVKFESPLTRQLLTKRSKNSHFSNLVIWRMR